MHKILQALVDTFLLAAGSTEAGSAMYLPAERAWYMHPRAAPTLALRRELPAEHANSRIAEPARSGAENSRI